MTGLLDMYFPAEDPMNPANLLPHGLLGPSVLSRMQQASDAQRGRWQAGERGPTPLNEENMWLADDVAGGLLGPMAMAGIFAGVGAKTANKAALETAQRMASEGADPRAIWRDTGWFQGPEGKWRWEIDDSGAKLTPKTEQNLMSGPGANSGGSQTTAAGFMRHPEMFDAYPQLRQADVDARHNVDLKHSTGSWNADYEGIHGGRPQVNLSTNQLYGPQGALGVGLHEFQHGVQGVEDFARGANVAEYARGPMFDKKARDLSAELSANLTGGVSAKPDEILMAVKYGDPEELAAIAQRHGFASVDEALEFLRYQDEKRTPYSQYKRTAGEAEARAVQRRMDMTPEQRRATFPLDSYDVPLDELIVRQPGGGVQMSDGGLLRRPYEGAPDSLMGFRRSGENVPFEGSNYKHVENLRITLPGGDTFDDAIKGLNPAHAMERARRNWPGAVAIVRRP